MVQDGLSGMNCGRIGLIMWPKLVIAPPALVYPGLHRRTFVHSPLLVFFAGGVARQNCGCLETGSLATTAEIESS